MDEGIQKIVDEANAELSKHTDKFKFDWTWRDIENLLLDCNGAFTEEVRTSSLYGVMCTLHLEFARKIERYLNASYGPPANYDEVNEVQYWAVYDAEHFFWDEDGVETFEDEGEDFVTMQYQIYWNAY